MFLRTFSKHAPRNEELEASPCAPHFPVRYEGGKGEATSHILFAIFLRLANSAKQNISSRNIGAHHNSSGRNLGAYEPQRRWLGILAKEALAPPQHHWKSPHVVLVDQ